MNASNNPERRADLLGRLQETEDRHAAAEQEQKDSAGTRAGAEQTRILRQALEEVRAVVAETRQLNYEMRESFRELLDELRRPADPS